MKKVNKLFISILVVLILLSMGVSVAQDADNSTLPIDSDQNILSAAHPDQTISESDKIPTKIDVANNTTFDVVGKNFKIRLSDEDGNTLANETVIFRVNGVSYQSKTNDNGISSLQIRLKDGTYKITTDYLGNSLYDACTKTTTITVKNTRVVEAGLSNDEIQKIIDEAKVNNVILFKGDSYENINLVINKSLTLVSNSNTVLKSSSSNPVITVRGKNASLTTIKGFNIQSKGEGISIVDSEYILIKDNQIKNCANGIVVDSSNYVNITKNNIVNSVKTGVTLLSSNNSYVSNNLISDSGANGVSVANCSKVYIYDNTISNNKENAIELNKKINGVDYENGPDNVHITGNDINKNKNGISIKFAGDNINIKSNMIHKNHMDGLVVSKMGNNKIQSNVISQNRYGINFVDKYMQSGSQDISYNAIYDNIGKEIEAKDTDYGFDDDRLTIGDNWYSDYNTLCYKVKTNHIQLKVTQIGPNQYQVMFLDSKGQVASLLPDRMLSYMVNGQTQGTLTVSGGAATFTVDANNGDLVKAIIDSSERDNIFESDVQQTSEPINGKTPTYSYPSIPGYQIYQDIYGNGNGNGEGDGDGDDFGDSSNNGGSSSRNSRSQGNGTSGQNSNPGHSSNQLSDASQSYDSQVSQAQSASAQASASQSSSGGASSQSVTKQIVLDDDEIYMIAGISFIILLMLLTITFYYRDDIKEMKSKM